MDIKEEQKTHKRALIGNGKVKPEQSLERVRTSIAKGHPERPMFNEKLMEEVCERSNLIRAYKRVRQNKGAPGIDGITVEELGNFLKENWRDIRNQLLQGKYQPQPVRRIEISKASGKGKRKLGIPCVVDRLIQQALLQILQGKWDATFSKSSFGFRPGRSAHQAIAQVQGFVQEGYGTVVDVDLENFFNRVNHDKLMSRLAKEIADKRALKLIRSYLNAGIMERGVLTSPTEGVSQGGPLSPFLSNIVLDELDKELEGRGHKFARYGDDVTIYVRSTRAGERVMQSITNFIMKHLKLKVNTDKSGVDSPSKRGFLGFRIVKNPEYVRSIDPKSIERFKRRIRQLTRRNRSVSMEERIRVLSLYLKGWRAYYGYCQTTEILTRLDGWIRRRLRSVYWKQWKIYRRRKSELIKRGIPQKAAHCAAWSAKGPWRMSHIPEVRIALNNDYFDSLKLPRLAKR